MSSQGADYAFKYYKGSKKTKCNSRSLAKEILSAFSAKKKCTLRDNCYVGTIDDIGQELFRIQLLQHLRAAIGKEPKLKLNKDGTYTLSRRS
jgi:hypothetical protein